MAEGHGDVDILRRIEDTTLNDQDLARDAGILENFKLKDSAIRTYLKDKCIFITGGTGFLGKCLVEKLLRSCSEIKGIFLLIRKKKNKGIQERVDEMFNDPLYGILKKERPHYRQKIILIEGNTEEENLGIDPEQLAMIKDQVNIIFHAAATVRFDEELKKAVRVNVKGTSEAYKIAMGCGRLTAFVQFSTAFSFCTQKQIDEIFYDPPMKPIDLINLVENTSNEKLIEMTPQLLGRYPNTYAYTKAVAEDLTRQYGPKLPICLFRPSIVLGTYREPIRGWCDNLNGPSGIIVGAGVGLLHTLYCDAAKLADMVPVDMVVNAAIACAWKTSIEGIKTDGPRIYNYVSSCEQPTTWADLWKRIAEHGINFPTVHAIWYYSFILESNWYIFLLQTLFLHFIPGFLADTVCLIMGKKAMLLKTYKKIFRLNNAIAYFTKHQWKFTNQNTQNLCKELNPADYKIFNLDMSKFDWERHAETCIIGLRVYVVKDPVSTIPECKIKWRRLKILHYTTITVFKLLALYLLYLVGRFFLSYIF